MTHKRGPTLPVNPILHIRVQPLRKEARELVLIHVLSFDRETSTGPLAGVQGISHFCVEFSVGCFSQRKGII